MNFQLNWGNYGMAWLSSKICNIEEILFSFYFFRIWTSLGNTFLTTFMVSNVWLGIRHVHLSFQSRNNQKKKKEKREKKKRTSFCIQVSEVENQSMTSQRLLEFVVPTTEVLHGVKHSRYGYIKGFCQNRDRIWGLLVLTERRVNYHTFLQWTGQEKVYFNFQRYCN